MKTAVIHDWLTGMRGGERVLEAILDIFPEADIYTLICDKNAVSDKILKHKIHTSFLQNIPGIFKNYRNFLPIFPVAIESFNLAKYDLIISSTHCVAQGVKHPASCKNVAYSHTPMRYAWDQFSNYFSVEKNGKLKYALISAIMPGLRKWDVRASKSVDYFIANSNHVKDRISRYYNREATVIHPPVDTEYFTIDKSVKKENFFLMVTALTEYKKVDFVVNVFNSLPKEKVVIVGNGPMEDELRQMIKGNNIELHTGKSREEIRDYYRRAKAFLFPGEEDFGITMVESQACGTPVLAYGIGGARDSVVEGKTGEFFNGSTADFIASLMVVKDKKYDLSFMRSNAEKFSGKVFREKMESFLKEKELL